MKPLWSVLILFAGIFSASAVPVRPGIVREYPGPAEPVIRELSGDERGYAWRPVGGDQSIRPSVGNDPLRPAQYGSAATIPVIGRVPVYVLAVDFPDQEATHDVDEVIDELDADVGSYFATVSRGMLDLDFIPLIRDWVRVDSSYRYFGADGAGVDNANGDIFELTRLALIAADISFDYSSIDINGNGEFDAGEFHLLIIHAGDDQAFTGDSRDIWSHRWWVYGESQGYEDTVLDGILVSEPGIAGEERSPGYAMVAWSDRLGVICHELMHSFGAPDLYDVGGNPDTPVGYWSLMDIGVWLGNPQGSSPCRPGGYLEWDVDADPSNGFNGWMYPVSIHDGGYAVSCLGSEHGTELYLVETPVDEEYFLIENRLQSGTDHAIPESGILIYHIDESQPVNNVESMPPYRVWLEDPGIRAYKRGAAYSADDGPVQTAFTPGTDPGTETNRGFETSVAITGVSEEDEVMNFVLSGVGGPGQSKDFIVIPSRVTAGDYVTAVLPGTGGTGGAIGLYNFQGRIIHKRTVSPGAFTYAVEIPVWTNPGPYILHYSSSDIRYSTRLIVLPDSGS